jgi:hypothetical protein
MIYVNLEREKIMIDKNILEQLREKQLSNKNLGSPPKAMFTNGIFNSENWNGGDDLIREYLYYIENTEYSRSYIDLEVDDECITMIVNFNYVEDQSYATIIVDGLDYDIYFFTWYKHRGRTEKAILNGKLITEKQYISLLNLIEKTGYKFTI